jgi:hypothetical protein
MRWIGALLLAGAVFVSAVQPAAARPRACSLLTRSLVEDYLNTKLDRTSNARDFCDYQSHRANLHRNGDLRLTTWLHPANARRAINGECGQKRARKLTFTGYNRACGFQAKTGLCFDTCQFEVKIAFRRGRTTGSLDVAALQSYKLNDLKHAIPFARNVLARWK